MNFVALPNGQEAAAQQSPLSDTIHSSVTTGASEPGHKANGPDPQPRIITVSAEDFALIEEAKRERSERSLNEKVKLHAKILSSRRITVALRRINLKAIAPDRDVLAYIEVCNLKAVAGEKAEASEEEMAAYLALFSQGVEKPTLAAIKSIVTQQ